MTLSMTFWPVSMALSALVDPVYVFRNRGAPCELLAGSVLPGVHWLLSGALAWVGRSGVAQPIRQATFFGPTTAAVRVQVAEHTTLVGASLFPEGWATLMPIVAGHSVERVGNLAALWGDMALPPPELTPTDADEELANAFSRTLAARLETCHPADPRIAAISRWANGNDHDIGQLAARLRVSERQLDRICIRSHGLPPRSIANKQKIMRMAAVLALGVRDNRRDVWTSEYADQSHFIRNFRRFIGVTPSRFLSDPSCYVRDLMRARFAINSAHPLGLAEAETARERD